MSDGGDPSSGEEARPTAARPRWVSWVLLLGIVVGVSEARDAGRRWGWTAELGVIVLTAVLLVPIFLRADRRRV